MTMPVRNYFSVLTVASLICLNLLCLAQEYSFRHLTTKNGLPSNYVTSIFKDNDGFMWFGTTNGIARYDGYDVKVYRVTEDSLSAGNSQVINDVLEDKDGKLWIGTKDRGLLVFDRITEKFIGFTKNPEDTSILCKIPINIIYQDKQGIFWVGTDGGGLIRFDPDTQNTTVYKQEPGISNGPEDRINALLEDHSGTFWVGTGDGLFSFDRKQGIFSRIDLGKKIPPGKYREITCIVEDINSFLWIGSKWGLFKYDIATGGLLNYLPLEIAKQLESYIWLHLSNLFITSVTESTMDKSHVLWITTEWGLNRFDLGNNDIQQIHTILDHPGSIGTDQLTDSYIDDDGQLWIATYEAGIEILNARSNRFEQVRIMIPEENVVYAAASFLIDHENTLWVGGIDGGIFHYDSNFNYISQTHGGFIAPDRRHNNRIDCIYEDSHNRLWLGYYNWGPVLFDRTLGSFTKVELDIENDKPKPITFDNILEDDHGILWIGTDKGLYFKSLEDGLSSPARMIRHDNLTGARIIRIFKDRQFNLWISVKNQGLFCLREEDRDSMKFLHYLSGQGEKGGYFETDVNAIFEDQVGTLWLGSDKGLSRVNFIDKTVETESPFNEFYSGKIIQVYGDDQNNLWIFHAEHGLIRYKPYAETINAIKVFDAESGLPFDKFNTRFSYINSFYQSSDGRLFLSSGVGTGRGILWFHPDSIRDNEKVPNIFLTAFNPGNKDFVLDSNIRFKRNIILDYDQNFFSFEFAALDFLSPGKNQYAYYLEGFEDDWNYTGNRRFANYTGVPPGEYIFRIKGSNNDGYWNEEGNSVRISIKPPYWATWWAYLIYSLVFIAIISSIIHFYLRRQKLLNKLALEQVEAEKLKELDSMKTRFFTNISHEFRTPLTLILGPIQQLLSHVSKPSDRQSLSIIQQNAQRLRDLVNQLLSLSKLESGKMVLHASQANLTEFVRSYLQSFESLARQKKIQLKFFPGTDDIQVYIDKEKIARVLNNLLSNAFKFTPAGGWVEVRVDSRWSLVVSQEKIEHMQLTNDQGPKTYDLPARSAFISVSDTGPGIAPDHLSHIFDRFYQVDDSISREQEGTGIGLAITQEMVKLHHGEIVVESEVGKGTTFLVLLPMGRGHLREEEINCEEEKRGRGEEEMWRELNTEPETRIPYPGTRNAEPGTEKPLLLIVEDNPDMRSFIRGYFEEEYQVMEAQNGSEGLDTSIEHIPDIVISDVMMPKMDGYEFCRKLKTDEKTSHIPVILLTARASKESRLEGLETGADDFVTKPFDGEELQVRVKNLVVQRKKLSDHYQSKFELITGKSPEAPFSMDEKFLIKARAIVQKNLSNPDYGVESFSMDMALSRVQLHRKLRALVDQSVTEFIRTIRLNYAISLLQKKTATISEIAYDAGFNSPNYFTISFKKKYGISPSEYLDRLDNN